ncbi:MAG: hypothetical protein RIC35_00365 [Marinoscillum sp.]
MPNGLSKKQLGEHEVIVVDYRGKTDEELMNIGEALQKLILKENKFNRRLVYVKDVNPSPTFRVFLRKMGKNIGHVPSKVAIIGLSPTKRVLMQAYNKLIGGSLRFYDDEKDGIDYLTSG